MYICILFMYVSLYIFMYVHMYLYNLGVVCELCDCALFRFHGKLLIFFSTKKYLLQHASIWLEVYINVVLLFADVKLDVIFVGVDIENKQPGWFL